MKRPQIVYRISEAMHRAHSDVEVILYGSEARGEARPDSDFDLLLLVDTDKAHFHQKEMSIADTLLDVELETGANISSYILPRSKWENPPFINSFHQNVERDGIRL